MENIFISENHKRDADHFTTNTGLSVRRHLDKPFKKAFRTIVKSNIIFENAGAGMSDDEYFNKLVLNYIPLEHYDLANGKSNIIVERYPRLNADEPYIFVCNHTCPEDIETVLSVLDRNAYLVLGSIESLKYNPEMYALWVNGMIPFDIMDKDQRKQVLSKMCRVLKTNSVLIFPEGSHNFNPNKLVNPLFDGPINASLKTGKKIVAVTLIRDDENNVSYVDVSNPIDLKNIEVDMSGHFETDEEIEKHYVNSLTNALRNKTATSVYYLIKRHFRPLNRGDYYDIEEALRMAKIEDAFKKLRWKSDVFDAEYLVKKTADERDSEEVVKVLSNLSINYSALNGYRNNYWLSRQLDIDRKNTANRMRQYWISKSSEKVLAKEKK